MKYKLLTEDEIELLPKRTLINMGDGVMVELLNVGQIEKTMFGNKTKLCTVKDGEVIKEWYISVLTQGTIETLDKTVVVCKYCREIKDKKDSINTRIFRNRQTVYYNFCKGTTCAGYYQMGCEG